MRVTLCVDALGPNLSGIGRYTWQLCRGLEQQPDLDVSYFARHQFVADPASLLHGTPLPRRRFRRLQAWTDRHRLRQRVFHGTNYFLPPSVEGVVTVHDLSVFKYPDAHPIERVRAFERDFQRSLNRALHIITDTETVRAELIADLNVAPHMVTAVPLGVDDRFYSQDAHSVTAALGPLGLVIKGYGLCVSTLEPRKKIIELLTAWRRLPPNLRDRYPLVLAGGSGWRNERLRAEIDRGQSEGWLRHLGFVDESSLSALYAGAALFVYPSIYEGFGLPPLEAMASGTPAIVSNRSCLPEVSGDAARYIDPEDSEQFLLCLTESLLDDSWQAEASQRGRERARNFTWLRCVDQTIAVYHKVAD